MKDSLKFSLSAAAILLLSTVLLIGCMYFANGGREEAKPYQSDEVSDFAVSKQESPVDTPQDDPFKDDPLSQEEMRGKFSPYLQEEENTVTIFSEEQYAALKEVRNRKERRPLSYEEVLFLIGDSADLYFKYDEIRLTNAVKDGILHKEAPTGDSEIIKTYHGDFSEYGTQQEALTAYNAMLADIYSIIFYRIYMHDAGFMKITENSLTYAGKGLRIENEVFNASEDVLYPIGKPWGVESFSTQILAFSGTRDSGDAYRKELSREYLKMNEWRVEKSSENTSEEAEVSLKYPLLRTAWKTDLPICELWLVGTEPSHSEKIFPTAELMAMEPKK